MKELFILHLLCQWDIGARNKAEWCNPKKTYIAYVCVQKHFLQLRLDKIKKIMFVLRSVISIIATKWLSNGLKYFIILKYSLNVEYCYSHSFKKMTNISYCIQNDQLFWRQNKNIVDFWIALERELFWTAKTTLYIFE